MAIFFTIAGTNHHYGSDFMEKDMKVFLEKEPDNDHDREAIKVTMEGLGLVGYVAGRELQRRQAVRQDWRHGQWHDPVCAGQGRTVRTGHE